MKFGFQDQLFVKKPRKNVQGVRFSQCRSKTPILGKKLYFLAFLAHSSEMQNMPGRLHFTRFL